MGYLRSRGAVRLAVIVRECPFLVIKLSKFNSLITFCSICPLNWLYCSKIDAQRLDYFFGSQLMTPNCLFCVLTNILVPNAPAAMVFPNGIAIAVERFAKVSSLRLALWFLRTVMAWPSITKSVDQVIYILLWFRILFGPFVLTSLPKTVSCTTISIFKKKTQFLFFDPNTLNLVSINTLMEQGLVNFEYTKLCFTVGGEATDSKPSKVFQSVRVSYDFYIFYLRMYILS